MRRFYGPDYEALILEEQEREICPDLDPDYRGWRPLPSPRPPQNPPRRKKP